MDLGKFAGDLEFDDSKYFVLLTNIKNTDLEEKKVEGGAKKRRPPMKRDNSKALSNLNVNDLL
mgnify:FL=1